MNRYEILGLFTLTAAFVFITWLGVQIEEPRLGLHVLLSFVIFTGIQFVLIYFFAPQIKQNDKTISNKTRCDVCQGMGCIPLSNVNLVDKEWLACSYCKGTGYEKNSV
jgi:hypothetical protein